MKRLTERVCKIVVDECEQSMAWIGFAEQTESKRIVPVAHAGFEEGYLETLRLTWSEAPRGRGRRNGGTNGQTKPSSQHRR